LQDSVTQRRRWQRQPVNLEGRLTDLATPGLTVLARIVDISQTGVRLQVPFQLSPGALVKVNIADCALFAQVIHSRHDGVGSEVGVEVIRALIGESNLGELLNSILAENLPTTPGVRVGGTDSEGAAIRRR
jgi:PilZ domain